MKTTLFLLLFVTTAHADDWLQPIRDYNTIEEAIERRDRQAAPVCPPVITWSAADLYRVFAAGAKDQQKKDEKALHHWGPLSFKIDN